MKSTVTRHETKYAYRSYIDKPVTFGNSVRVLFTGAIEFHIKTIGEYVGFCTCHRITGAPERERERDGHREYHVARLMKILKKNTHVRI